MGDVFWYLPSEWDVEAWGLENRDPLLAVFTDLRRDSEGGLRLVVYPNLHGDRSCTAHRTGVPFFAAFQGYPRPTQACCILPPKQAVDWKDRHTALAYRNWFASIMDARFSNVRIAADGCVE